MVLSQVDPVIEGSTTVSKQHRLGMIQTGTGCSKLKGKESSIVDTDIFYIKNSCMI